MTSGRTFSFESIDHVARTCIPFVREIAKKHSVDVIILAGWSYGGVVASVVAKLLGQSIEEETVRVESLVLFDAPLRAPPKTSDGKVSATAPVIISGSNTERGSDGNGSFDLQTLTQSHFQSCTELLKLLYRDQQSSTAAGASPPTTTRLLQCAVYDVRPAETDYDCGLEAASELTSGVAIRITVPGTHWTMLFDDNVVSVGKAIKEYLH